jgi:hypothetical protein
MPTLHAPAGPEARRHEIPTHLDVEDRLLLGLPARRVLTLLCGAGVAYSLWEQLPAVPAPARAALAAVCVLLCVVLAFVRPAGRGLETWALLAVRHAVRPRAAVWGPAVRIADGRAAATRPAATGWEALAPRLAWDAAAQAAPGGGDGGPSQPAVPWPGAEDRP